MKNLPIYKLDAVDHLVQPEEFDDIHLGSPAQMVLTDFKYHHPHVVEAHIPAVEAAGLMSQENVRIKLVVDTQNEFIGLVSREDLEDQNIILTQVANGVTREEVMVADLMRTRESIRAISYEDVQRSTVEDLIHTLQRQGQRYCIVIDPNHHHIRGVISSAEISRRLHYPFHVESRASVVDMLSAVRR